MIQMHSVSKIYGTGKARVEALKAIDPEVKDNEFVGLIGPSGSGKSTLMNIIGCLDAPTSGEYFFAGGPTGNLDTKSGEEILAVFEDLWKLGHTLIVITHNLNISARAQRVVRIVDGRIAPPAA